MNKLYLFGGSFTLKRTVLGRVFSSPEGSLDAVFCLAMSGLSVMFSPLERGLKGCVTVRSAVGVEIIWLLFGGVVFLSFRWMFLISGSCARTSHTPAPSREGRFWMLLSSW